MVKVIVNVKPEAAAKEAKIYFDGTEITGNTSEIPAEKKSVKVEVKSTGYHSAKQTVELLDGEMRLEIEMMKRTGGGVRPPKRPDRPPSNEGGGLIDI